MQLPDLPSDQPLADELIRLLAARGPLTYEQVSDAFGEDPDDAEWDDTLYGAVVDEVDRIVELHDERLADAVTLLAPCTLTRRLTADEAVGGHLELGGDLQPFVTVVDSSVPLARHGRAAIQLGDSPGRATTERLVGPPGWLDDAGPGDLVGLRLVDGLLSVTVRPTPRDLEPAADAFAMAARMRLADADPPPRAGLSPVVWDALATTPSAFAGVLPPLSVIADAGGLQLTETTVLPADADPDEVPATSDAIRDAIAVVHYDADADMLASLTHLRSVTRHLEIDADVAAADLDRAAGMLADPDVFDAFLREQTDAGGGARLGAAVVPVATGTARAAAHMLQARDAWRRDDIGAADARLRDALAADPKFPSARIDAARIAEIRGDAAGALRHLQRAGVRDDLWLQRLRTYATGVSAGRNEPCPCGSGRKTKRCCGGGGASRPLAARAAWLLEKLYASHADMVERRLRDRLEAAARVSDWAEAGGRHPIVEDVALFDLGLVDDFLRRWAGHLPDDEHELAETWRATHRGLYQVRRVGGDAVTLVDRRHGTEYGAWHAGSPPPRGATILARLLPDGGGGWLLTEAVTADEHHPAVQRSLDADADPLDVAAMWGSQRPVLCTTEGEPTVHCAWEAQLPAHCRALLRAALLRRGLHEDEHGVFAETVEIDGHPRLRGTITADDTTVQVMTTSEPRVERLIGYIRDAVGDLEPSVDRRTPAWRAVADQRLYGVPPVPAEPTAEERAVLDEIVREQEQQWLDEPVPALSNLTPRQARDHPTGRDALRDLLDSFDMAPAGGFDPARLRSLLDL